MLSRISRVQVDSAELSHPESAGVRSYCFSAPSHFTFQFSVGRSFGRLLGALCIDSGRSKSQFLDDLHMPKLEVLFI